MLAAAVVTATAGAGEGGDVEAGRRKAESCAACHGPNGHSTNPAVPSLAGQPPYYTHWQLVLFRDGRRVDPQMSPLARGLSDADLGDLAAYYAAVGPAARSSPAADPGVQGRGAGLARAYNCDSCHAARLPEPRYTPHIAGLSYEYLSKQLRGFKAGTRGELETIMTTAAQPLTDEEIEVLARYFAGLPR